MQLGKGWVSQESHQADSAGVTLAFRIECGKEFQKSISDAGAQTPVKSVWLATYIQEVLWETLTLLTQISSL